MSDNIGNYYAVVLYLKGKENEEFSTILFPTIPPRYEVGDVIELRSRIDETNGKIQWPDEDVAVYSYVFKVIEARYYCERCYRTCTISNVFGVKLVVEMIE
jgi:hypothetical protein